MPWKELSLMSQRLEFVKFTLAETSNISSLCKNFNISRKTAYKWIKRFKNKGPSGLLDLSRKPHHSPDQTLKPMVQATLKIRDQHPAWGGRKIRARLIALGKTNVPSASTITSILKRENRLLNDPNKQNKPYTRFEHPYPNDLWQMDFKGYFQAGIHYCHPLTILDDHSRFNLCLAACPNEKTLTVKQHLTHTFRQYGLPYRMTMDNGAPWGHDEEHAFTPLTVWLMRLGIRVSHSRPYHPQTQGKDERFHRSLKTELLVYHSFKDLLHCQTHFDQWRNIYNLERPHEACDMKPPICRYQPSHRLFPETLPPIEYGSTDIVRKIYDGGRLHYKNKIFRIGKAFKGYPVALRPTIQDGIFDVYFCHIKIKQIDLNIT